ncbi:MULTISPECIES: hypothetical protein [unclassified Yoonia]|uniref:hypothetical protein n=1 Tax=unclassified Yoonia TaxID=2629118 RepID=UPI002AFFE332|nr:MULTISPECIES: hypothetical protein [unclassified Yoonia]
MTDSTFTAKPPLWFWAGAALGLAWNVFGLVQFVGSLTQTETSLIEGGLTAEQAATMTGYPVWMTIAFAIGVGGGTIGCALLLMRNGLAVPVFVASLAGYALLYIGDIVYGVFAAMGAPQVIVLTMVVAIAAALLWLSLKARQQFLLT